MYNHLLYLGYWFVNSLVLFFSSFFITDIHLGNARLNSIESAIYAGFWLTFCVWIWWDFAIARNLTFKGKGVSFLIFVIVNSASLFIISKFRFATGFEMSGLVWLLGIASIVTFLQRIVWKLVVSKSSFL